MVYLWRTQQIKDYQAVALEALLALVATIWPFRS